MQHCQMYQLDLPQETLQAAKARRILLDVIEDRAIETKVIQ